MTTTKLTHKAFIENIINGNNEVIAQFAEQNNINVEIVEQIADKVIEVAGKNPAIRIKSCKQGRDIYLHYDGRGWLGSFRGVYHFALNENGRCYAIYH